MFVLTILLNNIVNINYMLHKTNKKESILQAAEAAFLENGFNGTRTTDIAKRAGVTHAMLHYYFNTKELLFYHVFDSKVDLLIESMVCALSDNTVDIIERIQNSVAKHFDFLMENPSLPRFFIIEFLGKQERILRLKEKFSEALVSKLLLLNEDLQRAIQEQKIQEIRTIDLLLDIVSLNVFAFIVEPLAVEVFPKNQNKNFLENRKKENIKLITNRLTINHSTL